jgi:hypothetical protein
MLSGRKIVLLIVLLITFAITVYVVVVVVPARLAARSYEGAKQIGRDISKIFSVTPEITVNSTVVLQQQTPILELATVSQKFQHQYEWRNTWLGSTKKIMISGGFEAKAGYDLRRRFSIDINDEKAIVTLPPPQLLSVQSMDNMTFRDENGVWNWVNMEDRAKAINAFTADARNFSEKAAFISAAKETMERQLREILAAHGKEVEIRYSTLSQPLPLR